MTAQEHLAEAERILADLSDPEVTWQATDLLAMALEAIGHGLVAVAAELGVPHDTHNPQAAAGA